LHVESRIKRRACAAPSARSRVTICIRSAACREPRQRSGRWRRGVASFGNRDTRGRILVNTREECPWSHQVCVRRQRLQMTSRSSSLRVRDLREGWRRVGGITTACR
jgi:hypothetical protein